MKDIDQVNIMIKFSFEIDIDILEKYGSGKPKDKVRFQKPPSFEITYS